ncbi:MULTISPECIES: hypothetical protein [unclassified Acinetobacter]|uniref:hypothetical protein n=1 Tax=unclassified Acinetobacter TaxID=196816 RepID=UPI0035B7BFEA
MTKATLNDIDIILEQDMSASALAEHLRQAYFEISDEQEESFSVLIYKHKCLVSIEPKRKAIRLSMIDHLADYNEHLYARLFMVVNEANASLVNVSSFIFTHEHEGEEHIMLRVDQYISYHTALIMPQFVRLLRQFEEIDIEIFFNIMMPAVDYQADDTLQDDSDKLWN